MSRNEILVPEQQEAIVIDRQGGESISVNPEMSIVPGLEVRLAKRIIKPGSNRVMCLAAQTSVPLSDDDVASVSNLSLRLSDGTNVALSLSFFNDGATNACVPLNHYVPLNRYYFDPYRYTVHTQAAKSGSSLGIVLVATALIAAGGLYYFLGTGFNKLQHSPTTAKTALLSPAAAGHKAPSHIRTSKSAGGAFTADSAASAGRTPSVGRAAIAPSAQSASAEPAEERTVGKARTASRHAAGSAGDWQSSASENGVLDKHAVGRKFGLLKPRYEPSHPRSGETVHTSEPRAPRGNFLVPPPPPVMYNFPTGIPNFDFMPRLNEQPKSITPAKHAAKTDQPTRPHVFESTPQRAADPIGPTAPESNRSRTPVSIGQPNQSQSTSELYTTKALPDVPADLLGPISLPREKQNAIAAPIPGSAYPPLERIVIPQAPQDP